MANLSAVLRAATVTLAPAPN